MKQTKNTSSITSSNFRNYASIPTICKNGNRDIESYNKKISQEIDKLPYYIIVIDELADLMVQASKLKKESCELHKIGRAAEIHLVIATKIISKCNYWHN